MNEEVNGSGADVATAAVEAPAQAPTPTLTPAEERAKGEWAFLRPWFDLLDEYNFCSPSISHAVNDDIRVGDDHLHDAWLQAHLDKRVMGVGHFGDDEDSDESEDDHFESEWASSAEVHHQLRVMRDAVLITGLVGKTDYDAWLVLMQSTLFHLTEPFQIPVNGKLPQFPIRWEFQLTLEHNMLFMEWKCLKNLLSDHIHTNEYLRDIERIRDILAKRGISWHDIEPTPIKLKWVLDNDLYFSDDVSCRILRLTEGIQRTQQLEIETKKNEDGVGCLFRVTSLEIDLYHTPMHDRVLEALTNLLQVGVPVSRLCLPNLQREIPSIHRWIPFVRLITGIDFTHEGKLASVRRIEIPATYGCTVHFGSLCSALSCARGVDVFCIHGGEHPTSDNSFTTHKVARDFVWRWLAFALFSSASTSSVKALYMTGERPVDTDNATIRQMIEAPDPFHALDVISLRRPGDVSIPRIDKSERLVVTIPRRTVFRASDGIRTSEYQSDHDLTGEVISTDGETVAFVPGYGLCRGQISQRPDKRAKLQPVRSAKPLASSLQSVALRSKDKHALTPSSLIEFLGIVGTRLRELELTIDVNEEILERAFQLCPKLESLSLTSATLSSMDVFERAYANGATITSLRLKGINVPADSLHAFFEHLATTNPPKKTAAITLERLYYEPPRGSATSAELKARFERVLQLNTNLSHFNGMLTVNHLSFLDGEPFSAYHGQPIPSLTSAQKEQLLALLGGLRVLAQVNSDLFLDAHIKQHIQQFAFAPRYRYVDWFSDRVLVSE